MTGTEYYKVGFTDRAAEQRLAKLQTGNPVKLQIVLSIPAATELDEQRLHARFIEFKTDGGDEWFRLSADQISRLMEDFAHERESNNSSPVGGPSPFDVRPVRGRQQHSVTRNGKDVSNGRSAFDHPVRKSLFLALRGKHEVGDAPVLREEREDDWPGDRELHGD